MLHESNINNIYKLNNSVICHYNWRSVYKVSISKASVMVTVTGTGYICSHGYMDMATMATADFLENDTTFSRITFI